MTAIREMFLPERMSFSDLVLVNLYSMARCYKLRIVSADAVLTDKTYKLVVHCSARGGKHIQYTYFLCEGAFQSVCSALKKDYNIEVDID